MASGSPSMFYREDLSKYENRVNWALFGCMLVPEMRRRVLERLGVDKAASVRPEFVEGKQLRPDFAIYLGDEKIANIEVELKDRDLQQDKSYGKLPHAIKWIVGKENASGDLSLVEIVQFVRRLAEREEGQAKANLDHCCLVIMDGLKQAKGFRPVERTLPDWFNDHPGLAAMKIAIPPLENWNFQPGGVSYE
jgi:hypothetical protein